MILVAYPRARSISIKSYKDISNINTVSIDFYSEEYVNKIMLPIFPIIETLYIIEPFQITIFSNERCKMPLLFSRTEDCTIKVTYNSKTEITDKNEISLLQLELL